MSIYIVVEYIDYEGAWFELDGQGRIQGYASKEEAVAAEIPKSAQKTLKGFGMHWDIIEVKLP